MRKIIIYCDRCNKEFKKGNTNKPQLLGIAEFVIEDIDPYLDQPKELCDSCYRELYNWWYLKN